MRWAGLGWGGVRCGGVLRLLVRKGRTVIRRSRVWGMDMVSIGVGLFRW